MAFWGKSWLLIAPRKTLVVDLLEIYFEAWSWKFWVGAKKSPSSQQLSRRNRTEAGKVIWTIFASLVWNEAHGTGKKNLPNQ